MTARFVASLLAMTWEEARALAAMTWEEARALAAMTWEEARALAAMTWEEARALAAMTWRGAPAVLAMTWRGKPSLLAMTALFVASVLAMARRGAPVLLAMTLSGCLAPYAPNPGAPTASVTFVNKGYTPVSMYHDTCGEIREQTLLAALRRGESATRAVTAGEPFSFTFYAPIGADWSCSLGFLTFTPVAGERYEIEFTQTGSGPPATCSVALYAGEGRVRQPLTDCRSR